VTRSFKHTPIFGNAVAYSEKKEKRLANRCFRRTNREGLAKARELVPLRVLSNRYTWSKDDRTYWRPGHLKRNRLGVPQPRDDQLDNEKLLRLAKELKK